MDNMGKTGDAWMENAAPEPEQQEGGSPYLVEFQKPFIFEGASYKSIDLSGLEEISAADMIAVNKMIERGGTVNILPEMSLEYACLISSRVSGQPVEFFKALPPKDALKVKNRVTGFLFGEG